MLSAVLFFWSLMFSVSTQMMASNKGYFLCSDICGGWSRCSSEISMDTQFWWLHLGHPRYLCGFSWSGVPTSINCDPRSISNGIFTIWILRHVPFSAHCYSTSCYTTPTSPWPGRLTVKKQQQQKCWKWRGYYQESPELGWPLTARTARHSCRNNSSVWTELLPGALPTVSSLFWVILTSSHTKKPSMAFALAAAPLRSRSNQEAWNIGSVDFSMQLNYCCSWASLTAKLCAQWQRGWLSDSLNYIQITLSHFSRDPSVHLQAL